MISKDISVSLAQICLSPKSVGPKSVSHRYETGIIRRFSRPSVGGLRRFLK